MVNKKMLHILSCNVIIDNIVGVGSIGQKNNRGRSNSQIEQLKMESHGRGFKFLD